MPNQAPCPTCGTDAPNTAIYRCHCGTIYCITWKSSWITPSVVGGCSYKKRGACPNCHKSSSAATKIRTINKA